MSISPEKRCARLSASWFQCEKHSFVVAPSDASRLLGRYFKGFLRQVPGGHVLQASLVVHLGVVLVVGVLSDSDSDTIAVPFVARASTLATLELSNELGVVDLLDADLLVVLMKCVVEVVFFEMRSEVIVELAVEQ